jgi:anhydro-N-acetylmuramic acid kinase
LDGVDLALMDFAKNPPAVTACDFVPMPEALRQSLSSLVKSGKADLQALGELDCQLGQLYAECVKTFLAKHNLQPHHIQAIGCHGQTVWHSPNAAFPFTTQIGDMNIVAVQTGITTIGDFRRTDIAYGGQGAPLVPAFHHALFAQPNKIVGVLNIGGISNISLLVPHHPTIGYDIGAGNTLMDSWIEQHHGVRFDKNGQWARTGQVNATLLADLLDEPFLQLPSPKSTGRELFNLAWLAKKLANHTACPPEDVQATLLAFTAQSIADSLANIENPSHLPCELAVCGGGAKNTYLMEQLAARCPNWNVITTNEYGVDVDFVEAAAFAWLAYQRMHHFPSNLPSVTGAKQAASLGVIFTK